MKELIEAYLKHTNHYLSKCEVEYVSESSEYNNTYDVHVKNECLACGTEVINISYTELLSFMWSKIKCNG